MAVNPKHCVNVAWDKWCRTRKRERKSTTTRPRCVGLCNGGEDGWRRVDVVWSRPTRKWGKKKRTDTYPDLPLSSYRPEDCPTLSSRALLEARSPPETAESLQPENRERQREGEGGRKKIQRKTMEEINEYQNVGRQFYKKKQIKEEVSDVLENRRVVKRGKKRTRSGNIVA